MRYIPHNLPVLFVLLGLFILHIRLFARSNSRVRKLRELESKFKYREMTYELFMKYAVIAHRIYSLPMEKLEQELNKIISGFADYPVRIIVEADDQILLEVGDKQSDLVKQVELPNHGSVTTTIWGPKNPPENGAEISRDMGYLVTAANAVEQVAQSYYRASKDCLTNLYSRWGISDKISKEIARAKRFERPLSLVMIDIDHFKEVNDKYGHDAGDEVLVQVAEILDKHSRASDIVGSLAFGRFSDKGDEFAALAPETDADGAFTLAAHLLKSIGENEFLVHDHMGKEHNIHVTVSIGVATFPNVASNELELTRNADRVLYRSKYRGRNQVTVARKRGLVIPDK